ncbi:MAG: polyphosphate kinase 1 [Coriobacteriaceae bacterium]|jgi:polyphosphate kinase|nr:polyphosphate kinase 1 [Coriobacteriaceae bacterium]
MDSTECVEISEEMEAFSTPYMQDRELSWLTFNERVLDQGSDPAVPLLERLNFLAIFASNLQEFFMIRVGSLTDLSLIGSRIVDNKTGLTPAERLTMIYCRCQKLYPLHEKVFIEIKEHLAQRGIHQLEVEDLDSAQRDFLKEYLVDCVMPILSPQIINALHPFPHLENGALHIIVRLDERTPAAKGGKKGSKGTKTGAGGVTLGVIPLPRQCERIIGLPGDGFPFILLESALELLAPEIFSMYRVKNSNVICITRNADLDAMEGADERDNEDYRDQMKRILKKRSRLAAVRLESRHSLSKTTKDFLLKRLELEEHQAFVTQVPLDMRYIYPLMGMLDEELRTALSYVPFTPQWPATLKRKRPIMEQVEESEILLAYPYESIDPFVELLREASADPSVVSIKITLYRLASQSHLAEELIAAAENGKEVTALFELRARFDETNNIEWSQRFEQAGAKVLYGFHDYKVHSKICCITRQTSKGIQYITQLGTGNYNEKTAKLYTDFSLITTDTSFGRDAVKFFRNMGLEYVTDSYDTLWVAPLQVKANLMAGIDGEIEKAQKGEPCGLFIKTNAVTDKETIEKLVEASQAGVPTTLFVRGVCCLVPGVAGYTENIRVVSVVGRLLEHSRVYGFGPFDSMSIYLASADLMTRNMERRIEIAWPIRDEQLRSRIVEYLRTTLDDTMKLRELRPDGRYTPLGYYAISCGPADECYFDSQEHFIKEAQRLLSAAESEEIKLLL